MPTAHRDEFGKLYHRERTDVALTAGANTTSAVTFDVAYPDVPVVRAVPVYGTGGTADGAGGFPNWAVQTVTKTGFVWNITSTGLGSVTVSVPWFAMEQA